MFFADVTDNKLVHQLIFVKYVWVKGRVLTETTTAASVVNKPSLPVINVSWKLASSLTSFVCTGELQNVNYLGKLAKFIHRRSISTGAMQGVNCHYYSMG